jgi:hypothetical protein
MILVFLLAMFNIKKKEDNNNKEGRTEVEQDNHKEKLSLYRCK